MVGTQAKRIKQKKHLQTPISMIRQEAPELLCFEHKKSICPKVRTPSNLRIKRRFNRNTFL
jgi:hypothetical protein